ncbi:MAG: hypothetical protein IT186_23405 [Acidobacteria bacterium]|nr:hypothetical protein [Acidobacteriota bacterium]
MPMFGKDDRQRIDDTLDFIANCNLVGTQIRGPVSTFVRKFVNTRLPEGSSKKDVKVFSKGMSMSKVHHSGPEGHRAVRRAIHLLWEAMGNHERAEKAKFTPAGDLRYDYKRTMEKAWIVSEKTTGGVAALKWVFDNGLTLHTKAFLHRNKIFIGGSTRNDLTQDQNVVGFQFDFEPDKDRYIIQPGGSRGYAFNAASVPAVHWTRVPGRGTNEDSGSFAAIRGTELGGANVMITTQFTGCVFCIKELGRVMAAHVAPSIPEVPNPFSDGTKLAKQVAGQQTGVTKGDFSNLNPGTGSFFVYGRGYSNLIGRNGYDLKIKGKGNHMYLIGFLRTTGKWKVYTQEFVDGIITKAERVYP